jgi:hypothetical protein
MLSSWGPNGVREPNGVRNLYVAVRPLDKKVPGTCEKIEFRLVIHNVSIEIP